jgi:hypothetical protein
MGFTKLDHIKRKGSVRKNTGKMDTAYSNNGRCGPHKNSRRKEKRSSLNK